VTTRLSMTAIALAGALAAACGDAPRDPTGLALSLHRDGRGRGTVVVDANGRGAAKTIQEGIDLAPAGGRVRVRPGTYNEALVINKGLTLESADRDDDGDDERKGSGASPSVTVSPPGTPNASIDVATPEPVRIRDLTVLKPGSNGILGNGVVDVTLEHIRLRAVGTGPGTNRLVRMVNNASLSGGRARLIVRESFLDGDRLETNAISLQGDMDAVIEDNVVRRMGGICMFFISVTPAGINADIVNNDLDECQGRTAIDVGPTPTQTGNFSTIGVVNIVGNRISNSSASCLPTTAIHYQLYTGRVERNSIIGFLQPCAAPITDALPAAIWVGSLRGFPPAAPVVRFNDIVGNAHAGVRVAPNITTSLDARCNHWGSASGPSGAGHGTGEAVVLEAGAAAPGFAPWATTPVAQSRRDRDDRDDDEDPAACLSSEWSEPVNLGPVVNSPSVDAQGSLSNDGLRLYFQSDRPGGVGGFDIWVSRRASLRSPWEAPVNLGPVINSTSSDAGASVSADEHLLFFTSNRPGGHGTNDIYVSRRADRKDDFGWEAPMNLGPHVNTATAEQGPEYAEKGENGFATLYFNRGAMATLQAELYAAPMTRNGEPLGPAELVAELSDPTANDAGASVRADGREILFWSTRAGTFGPSDLWVSTRRRVRDSWSAPENLGAPLNTQFDDQRPNLWREGRTLLFDSNRPGSLGASQDIWMSTRTQIGRRDR
jgi:hypothetical protein